MCVDTQTTRWIFQTSEGAGVPVSQRCAACNEGYVRCTPVDTDMGAGVRVTPINSRNTALYAQSQTSAHSSDQQAPTANSCLRAPVSPFSLRCAAAAR